MSARARNVPTATSRCAGEFAYGSDLWADGMVWGVTLRSPHPYARILSIDIGEALATAGVVAVLTADDVPGRNVFGLEFADQPVLAHDWVRYQGEPVALVAADDLEIARRAAKRIKVDYDVHEPVTDPRHALGHPYAELRARRGTRGARAEPRGGDLAPEGQPGPASQDPQG